MRISDWSSDVCSSDLCEPLARARLNALRAAQGRGAERGGAERRMRARAERAAFAGAAASAAPTWIDRGACRAAGFRWLRRGFRRWRVAGKSDVQGKGVSVRVGFGGARIIIKTPT